MKRKIALLALLAAFPPLSTDMYLGAIPLLVELWHQPLATVNMTLVAFFVTYCGFLLIYGPLSDRYGRRPPLLIGLSLFIVGSLLCAMATSIEFLIIARILQGAGAASATSISFAICKDLFEGRLRQRIFIQLGAIVAAAPMIAPVIGGAIIETFSWHWIFVLQAVMGLIAIISVASMSESLHNLSEDKLVAVFKSYRRLVSNKQFFLLTLVLSALGIPFFGFIAISSDVYITGFGYSEKEYGYFFACNASAFLVAPLVFSRTVRHVSLAYLLPISYFGVLVAAAMLLWGVIPLPYGFAVPMWFLTFFFAFGRPPGNNLLLEQVEEDVGAASSLMVFVFFLTGSVSMWFISLGWQNTIQVLGIIGVCSATVTLLGWLAINRFLQLKMP